MLSNGKMGFRGRLHAILKHFCKIEIPINQQLKASDLEDNGIMVTDCQKYPFSNSSYSKKPFAQSLFNFDEWLDGIKNKIDDNTKVVFVYKRIYQLFINDKNGEKFLQNRHCFCVTGGNRTNPALGVENISKKLNQ